MGNGKTGIMRNTPMLSGQWYGHFEYGEEYAQKLVGEKVKFSFILEDHADHHFTGKCIEIDGIGASTDISHVQGSMNGAKITFTKTYPSDHRIDDNGRDVKMPAGLSVNLIYKGTYYAAGDRFAGTWELWTNETENDDTACLDVYSGSWLMSRTPNI
jgi:hypothetical protein